MVFLSLHPTLFVVQSRSLSGRHVSTSFLDPILGAMMKQVYWHSRRSKAYRGLPEARMVASRLLRMYWSSRGLPRLLLAPFTASSEKWKNAHRRYTSCAGSPIQEFYLVPVRLLVQFRLQGLVGCCSRFCCCLAAISLMWLLGVSWWLFSGWTWCWGRIWGTLRVGSEVSKSCDWKLLCRE